ncbi:MAG: hypothetical protein JSU94_03505 [Phycisphaerales bacterium]|nr:MAG: hypothetical protein JSU94_03505 [Phycisphaerales bacterium]
MLWHDGKYYLFTMYSERVGDLSGPQDQWRNVWSAVSTDGVHWQDVGAVIKDTPFVIHGLRVSRTAHGTFVLNHGSLTDGPKCLRFWESKDLRHWKYLGKEYDLEHPKSLDHMDVLTTKKDGKTHWYGYAADGGIFQSDDGKAWKWASPYNLTDRSVVYGIGETGGGGSGNGAGKSAVVVEYILPKSELTVTRHGPWPAKVSTVRMGRIRVAE